MTKRLSTLVSSGRDEQIPRFPGCRVCEVNGCSTVLSTYNSTGQCSQHEVPRNYRPKPTSR